MADLTELDSVEIIAIIDNELDPISRSPNAAVRQAGTGLDITARGPKFGPSDVRGGNAQEFRMDNICCGAHGLSLMITGTRGDQRRTILFDTGPEESAWERNARRLRADIGRIETIQLSHWHRDHSGGMLKALEMIKAAKTAAGYEQKPVHVDLHPSRPDYRGLRPPNMPVMVLEADPSFDEIEATGAVIDRHDNPHTIMDGMFLVSGEIPRTTAYEHGLRFGVRLNAEEGEWQNDQEMRDERFLMCKLKGKGTVMFTGCSHRGVVNASRHAVELASSSPLYAVFGGFHLADADAETTQKTVRDLQALDVKLLLAGHCTGWRAKYEIEKCMPGRLVPSFVGCTYVL